MSVYFCTVFDDISTRNYVYLFFEITYESGNICDYEHFAKFDGPYILLNCVTGSIGGGV